MNIFKVSYYWYEGEEEHTFLVKDISEKEFEKELIKCLNKIDLKKEVSCLPTWYEQLIELLENLNYKKIYNIPFKTSLDIEYTLTDIPEGKKYIPIINKTINIQKIEQLK